MRHKEVERIDFASAFDPDEASAQPVSKQSPTATDGSHNSPFPVPTTTARILLKANIASAVLYSLDTVDILHAARNRPLRSMRGRIAIKVLRGGTTLAIDPASSGPKTTVSLPCTLLARSSKNYFELEEASYRGSMILAPGEGSVVSLINLVEVEDYLRGVVPLEIGRRGPEELEAVKAQAVAARTYAYGRILERQAKPFDLLATVADQVYGGVKVEEPTSDRAIALTRDMVLVYQDSLIQAYYHSTCGGRTANVEDVWKKTAYPYLRSVPDAAPDGTGYCASSRYYTWEEQWSTSRFSEIVSKFAPQAFPDSRPLTGVVRGFRVDRRFNCGRVDNCIITTTNGSYEFGGDKLRFLLRRDQGGRPILRSSSFEVAELQRGTITLRGRGYGHGVGMCQMGAIGRARAGQSYEQILTTYYTGAQLRRIVSVR